MPYKQVRYPGDSAGSIITVYLDQDGEVFMGMQDFPIYPDDESDDTYDSKEIIGYETIVLTKEEIQAIMNR